jgi:aspartyl-tRNA(Asn)/glutamyl-tRNA(Gln) amidotransferase subunit C
MSKLTNTEVLHVAKLAKLNLSEEEIEKFTTQLSSVLDYINELNEVDTSNIEPTSQTTGLENVKRDDVYKTDHVLTQAEALAGSDKTHNGYFKVDAVLSGRTDK